VWVEVRQILWVKLSEAVFDVPAQASFFFKKKTGHVAVTAFPER
jgi:hypothetical protein